MLLELYHGSHGPVLDVDNYLDSQSKFISHDVFLAPFSDISDDFAIHKLSVHLLCAVNITTTAAHD